MSRAALFAAVRPFAPGGRLAAEHVPLIDAVADAFGLPGLAAPDGPPAGTKPAADWGVTERIALELLAHEAIVQEAYKDSEGVWTWGVGITDASGHSVGRYRDNPQSIERVLEVYLWALGTRYAPAVRAAFAGMQLTEAQFGAALSFHYNTGAIGRAGWVESWKAGDVGRARDRFMEWRKPAAIIERREKERDLFFDGRWSGDGTVMVWPVRKPSYTPDFRNGRRGDVRPALRAAMAEG